MSYKPSAVASYGFDAKGTKGKNHPSAVNPGLGGVTGRAKSPPAQPAAGKGTSHVPVPVTKHDGAANMGAKEKCLTAPTPKTAFTGTRSTIPSAVHECGGLKAPRSAR